MTDGQKIPNKADDIIVNDDDEAPSLLNPMTGEILITNQVGKTIMDLADGQRSVDDIVSAVVARFKGPPREVIEEDVHAFLDDASNKGIIHWQT